MNGECGQMTGMGMKGITRKNDRGLLLAGLNVGTGESGMYVCERSNQSGRRGRMVCIRTVSCRHALFL